RYDLVTGVQTCALPIWTSPAPRNDDSEFIRIAGTRERTSPTGEFGEFPRHPRVDRALERHDQVGKIREPLPAPRDEFRLMAAGEIGRASCRERGKITLA